MQKDEALARERSGGRLALGGGESGVGAMSGRMNLAGRWSWSGVRGHACFCCDLARGEGFWVSVVRRWVGGLASGGGIVVGSVQAVELAIDVNERG